MGQARKPIDRESLGRKQDHCDFNNDEFFGLGDDAERNDEGRGSCGRMAYPEQRHKRTRSRQRKRSGQDPGAMDAWMQTERWAGSHSEREGGITTDKSDCVAEDG